MTPPVQPSPRTLWAAWLLLWTLAAAGALRADDAQPPTPVGDALRPASAGHLEQLDRDLQRLTNHRRLLIVAAHPDDEDTTLLTWAARAVGGEAAYLSLSRGEGGQNLIGERLGVGLGLVRSRELEAARAIDGGHQFFSRAYDFGYTRSLDETFARWPRAVLLEDTVRIVRRFKPQVLVAIFPPDARAGHGQHIASAVIAEDAIAAAADPLFAPHLGAPWTVDAFYRAAWWRPTGATHAFSLGVLEPVSGRSILQLATDSRSQHRSQDMGLLQPLGTARGRLIDEAIADRAKPSLAPPDAAPRALPDPFDAVDGRLAAIADLLPADASPRAVVEARLEAVAARATRLRARLHPAGRDALVPELAALIADLDAARAAVAEADGAEMAGGFAHVRQLLDEKRIIAGRALASASGVALDAFTDVETVVPGASFGVRVELWNSGSHALDAPTITIVGASAGRADWTLDAIEDAKPPRGRFVAKVDHARQLTVTVPADAPATVPYFLRRGRLDDLYDWRGVDEDVLGAAFAPPPLRVRVATAIAGAPLTLEREVVMRQRDQAFGEVRRPLRVVPAFEVTLDPAQRVLPIDPDAEIAPTIAIRATVRANRADATAVQLRIGLPPAWRPLPPVMLAFNATQRTASHETIVAVPSAVLRAARTAPQRIEIAAAAIDPSGSAHDIALDVIDHPHIRTTAQPVPARGEIVLGAIVLPELREIAYVRGASDRVPEALRQIGVPLALRTAAQLEFDDLSRYDVIVIGSRAYEVDAALGAVTPRLLDWTRRGGRLIVQYQQYAFVNGEHAPYPLTIARPHDRITDETAALRPLVPDHAVFRQPNVIGPADWDGWVQERGLYFARTWDDAYRALLAGRDPDDDADKTGGLLVAAVGDGVYVYTGLAFFRQLPAGVVGAYRLFANLLALERDAVDP